MGHIYEFGIPALKQCEFQPDRRARAFPQKLPHQVIQARHQVLHRFFV
jgi:hypothetical protein